MEEDLRYIIALMNIKGVGSTITRHLISEFGSAKAVFEADRELLCNLNGIGEQIISQRNNPAIFEKADSEIAFMEAHNVKALVYGQTGYPTRLLECPDAPALLFFLGTANLDSDKIISIVGTRNATQYGIENVRNLVEGIKEHIPNALIVSGLAFGIDVSSHKAALEYGLPTVGVLAHGLDRVYPYNHRDIAKQMIIEGGGLLTEYSTGNDPERGNFLSRNRIIAGLADAVIVAESKEKGGSLVTASIALDYNRDVFAFPGRVNDDRSKGCNRLIRLNRAGLITCADDFLEAMNWNDSAHASNAIQHSIPFEEEKLSRNARLIIDTLRDRGDLLLSQLSDTTGLEHATLYEELLDLEMDGKIRSTPGGLYQLK